MSRSQSGFSSEAAKWAAEPHQDRQRESTVCRQAVQLLQAPTQTSPGHEDSVSPDSEGPDPILFINQSSDFDPGLKVLFPSAAE